MIVDGALKYKAEPVALETDVAPPRSGHELWYLRRRPHDQRIHGHHGRTGTDDGVDIEFRNQAALVRGKLGNPDEYVGEARKVHGRRT